MTTQFDVVIAGGGMAGSTLAWALLQAMPELRIAIIEQQAELISQASFDSRSIALAASSCQLLAQWQLWQQLKPNACAIEHIQVSDRGHVGKTRISAGEYQLAALGYVIEVEYLGAHHSVLQRISSADRLHDYHRHCARGGAQPPALR